MIKVLENAVDKVKVLPAEQQAYAAAILEQLAAAGGVFAVPEAHKAAIHEGLAQAERGEFVDDATVARTLRLSWA